MIEPFQKLLYFCILNFHPIQCFPDTVQTHCIIRLIDGACFVFVLAKVLNFFARVFDFGQAKGCRRSFQKMALGAQILEVAFLPVVETVSGLSVQANAA